MLVLSRKKEEQIQIGPEITITILRIKGRSVQIGIEAPTGVTILRSELAPEEIRRRVPRPTLPPSESLPHGVGPVSFRTGRVSRQHCEPPTKASA